MDIKNKRELGSLGESIAAKYLMENGFSILYKNFRVGKLGEIDIIAREKEFICFVEVKTRKWLNYGSPAEAVNYKKQEKIRKMANIYINQHNLHNGCFRFDVVEIVLEPKTLKVSSINLIRNAF